MNSLVCLAPILLPNVMGFTSLSITNRHARLRHEPLAAFLTDNKGILGNIMESFGTQKGEDSTSDTNAVQTVFQAWNDGDLTTLVNQFDEDCVFDDTSYYETFDGKGAINRHFRLLADAKKDAQFVVDDMIVDDNDKVAVCYHLETEEVEIPNSRRTAFYTLDPESGLIASVLENPEPAFKTGEIDLAVVSFVSKLSASEVPKTQAAYVSTGDKTPPEQYFDAWSRRDLKAAVALFDDDDCRYDDTVFPTPFTNKADLAAHLEAASDAFPPTFTFVVDNIAGDGDAYGVLWHVENNGEQVIFTRGCSIYKVKQGKITSGLDIIEPAVWKLGGLKNFAESFKNKIVDEPVRLLPLAVWVAYMYTVFLSDGILPGASALALEQRTWEEVRDLSLNFFFVAPLLNLPFAPTVHPVLEGVFNLVLSWAALFAGFLSDERKGKQNLFAMLPAVVGMQFLTSAFLLPYLTLRTTEAITEEEQVYKEDLDLPAKLVENRAFGPFLGLVGSGTFAWAAMARMADFGGLEERMASYWQLLSIDRVGSSFLVDFVIFYAFQGWLVDDDLRRRGVADENLGTLRSVAKYIPFFGLAAYMFLRPEIAEREPDV